MQVREEVLWTMRTASDELINRVLAQNPNVTAADQELLLAHPLINDMLLSGLSLRMVILDLATGSYVYASPDLMEFHHPETWEQELALGWKYIDPLVHPEDAFAFGSAIAQFGEYLQTLAPRDQPNCKVVTNFRLRNTKGEYRKLLQQVIPFLVKPTDEQVRYMAVVLQDITLIHRTDEVNGYLVHRQGDGRDEIIPLTLPSGRLPVAAETPVMLTAREREVLRWLVRGQSSKMIADQLTISADTVSVHRRNLMRKTRSANAAQLSAFALRAGLV